MKVRRRHAINLSLFLMLFGFLIGLVGMFGNRVVADQVVVTGSDITPLWLIVAFVGVVSIISGLVGVIFAIAAYRD